MNCDSVSFTVGVVLVSTRAQAGGTYLLISVFVDINWTSDVSSSYEQKMMRAMSGLKSSEVI